MAEKIEFDIAVKGGTDGNNLSKALDGAIKKSFDLEGALTTAVGVFGGNVFTKALDVLKNQIGKAVDESINFKRAQLEIETILPKNTKLTAEFVGQLEDLSKQYGTSATSQAKAYYEIISAGVSDVTDGAKLLARANELATGGVTDTANTIDLLTTIYNVYGREVATAAEASDSLFKTVQIGKTTIAELSQDLGQALPIAKSFGIGLDEVGAILAQLTNSGISTSESVTLLNAVLSAIAKNGDELGKGFNSTAVQTDGLGVVLDRLKERTNGSNDALFKLLGRQEAVRAVQSLTAKGLENYNKTLAEYSDKAGIAADASKKIIDNDLGKQFEILGSKIGAVARSLIDEFVPATLSATKAVNDFFSPDESLSNEQISKRTEEIGKRIAQLNLIFKAGTVDLDFYNKKMQEYQSTLDSLDKSYKDANTPLITLTKESENLTAQIAALKNGFDSIGGGPILNTISVTQMEDRLAAVKARIDEIKKVTPDSTAAGVAPEDSEKIKNKEKLNAQLIALQQQFQNEQRTFKQEFENTLIEDEFKRNEAEIQRLAEFNIRKAEIDAARKITEAEASLTDDALNIEKKKIQTEKEIAIEDAKNKALINSKKNSIKNLNDLRSAQDAYQDKVDAKNLKDQNAFFDSAITLQSAKSKELAAIGKAAAIVRATIHGKSAVIASYDFGAEIGGPITAAVFAGIAAAATAAQIAQISGIALAGGGVVGGEFNGAAGGGDDVQITARKDEMYLNAQQQKNLFDAINGGGLGGGGDIVIKIDEREIARAVRNQRQQGFAV